MKKEELVLLYHQLEIVFDIVRVVDVLTNHHFIINEDDEIIKAPSFCFEIWGKNKRCENCISAKSHICKEKETKFEFIENEVYHVISKYIELLDKPYILEMVVRIDDDTLFGTFKKNEFVESVSRYNEKLYIDPLTRAYNRRYYEEFLNGLDNIGAIAMLDVDNFKEINDTFGHVIGDLVLKNIVESVHSCIKSTDMVIRYGGDEFLIAFNNIQKKEFEKKLEEIRKEINDLELLECQGTRFSVSIGGTYITKDTQDMIFEADRMLYEAKTKRNSVKFTVK